MLLLISGKAINSLPPFSTLTTVAPGRHPATSTAPDDQIDLVFGRGNSIYYTTSTDAGRTFTEPALVDSLPYLHLGASRGPQIASGRTSAVITAVVGREGTVTAYRLDRKTNHWSKQTINDVPDVAREGFVSLASDGHDFYYAAWLDLRGDARNKIVGTRSTDGGRTWSANAVLYRSPEGTVCECCRPSVAVDQQRNVALQFRNWLAGSRDLYLLRSTDSGQRFGAPEKLGRGTWKLNACPMDGGAVAVQGNRVQTIWRREQTLYAAQPGQVEVPLGTGKLGSLTLTPGGTAYAWQRTDGVYVRLPNHTQTRYLGPGGFAWLTALRNQRAVLCAWEDQGQVRVAVLPTT